jgi:hypothetical protein
LRRRGRSLGCSGEREREEGENGATEQHVGRIYGDTAGRAQVKLLKARRDPIIRAAHPSRGAIV